jgi:hypothetical protein
MRTKTSLGRPVPSRKHKTIKGRMAYSSLFSYDNNTTPTKIEKENFDIFSKNSKISMKSICK